MKKLMILFIPIAFQFSVHGNDALMSPAFGNPVCDDVSTKEKPDGKSLVKDSVSFKDYVTNEYSKVIRDGSNYIVLSEGLKARVISDRLEVKYTFDVQSLNAKYLDVLKEIGFSKEVLASNEQEKTRFKDRNILVSHAKLSKDETTLRMLGVIHYVDRVVGERPNQNIFIDQAQIIIDVDLKSNEVVVARLPYEIEEIGNGYCYTWADAKFISFNRVLIRNTIGSRSWIGEVNGYGIVDLTNMDKPRYESWKYALPSVSIAENEYGRIPVQTFNYYEHGGELFMHIHRDSMLIPKNKLIDPIAIHLNGVERRSDYLFESRPWMEKVVDYKGSTYVVAMETEGEKIQKTLILDQSGDVLATMNGAGSFIGMEDGIVYLQSESNIGLVYKVDLNELQ